MDFISSIAMLTLTSQDNLKFLGGDKLVSRMNKFYYLSLAGIPALHYATKKLEKSEYTQVRDAVNFVYLHISDVVLVASAVQAFAAAYYGFNKAGNLLQLACLTWSVAEQGVFWMRPQEDSGPVFNINDGELVRTYEPVVAALNLTVGVPFYFFYRGIGGKFTAVMSLITCFAPQLILKVTPQSVIDGYNQVVREVGSEVGCLVNKTPTAVENKWIVEEEYDALDSVADTITEKHFDVFKIEDCFPQRTLEDLEAALQRNLAKDQDPKLEEIGYIGTRELTNRQILEELLGSLNQPGYLRRHVIACRTREEKVQKEVQLKNIFGAILKDWDDRKSQLLANYDNFLCRTATGSTITELSLEFYADIFDKTVLGQTRDAQVLENRIANILQQRRDRSFYAIAQGLIMAMQQQERATREQWAKEEAELYAPVESWNYSSLDWWADLGAYLKSYLKHAGFGLLKDMMLAASTARHQINISTVVYGRALDLSYYEEARRDVKLQLAKQLQDISMLDRIGDLYTPILGKILQQIYADGMPRGEEDGWRDELIKAIASYQDTRLDFDLVWGYLRERAGNLGQDIDPELSRVESLKPKFDSKSAPREFELWKSRSPHVQIPEDEQVQNALYEQWFDENWTQPNKRYEQAKTTFLEKYMPQVLFDLDFVTE